MCRKQNLEIVFEFKSDTTVLNFTVRFVSSPLFSFAEHLVGFISVGKVLRNAFTILRLDKRKGRVWTKIFMETFRAMLYVFFAFFSSVLYRIVIILE